MFQGISEERLLASTKAADEELTMDEMRRNTTRQDKIFLHRNSNATGHAHINGVIIQTSYCPLQKLPIDSATSGIGGWLSSDDNAGGLSNSLFPSPIKNLQDITNDQAISATFFNSSTLRQ